MRFNNKFTFDGAEYSVEYDVAYRVHGRWARATPDCPAERPSFEVVSVNVVSVTTAGGVSVVPSDSFVSMFSDQVQSSDDVRDACMDQFEQYNDY